MKTKFQRLHERAIQISKAYLKAEYDLISILKEIDDCQAYRELGFKSLFEYSTQGLGLSESVSYNLITIARKAKEVPQLQEMIRKQEISVSNARMIAPVLTFENQGKWLSAASSLSKRVLEKEIAKEFPEESVQESSRYVSEKRIELKLGISEGLHEKLRRVQDLLSSQTGQAASLEETLDAALELYVEKMDPQRRAERAEKRGNLLKPISVKPVPGQVKSSHLRFIPARLEHAVRLRDQGQCTLKANNGLRCPERRWIEIHHIRPLSEGGTTELKNLTLVCRGHHQLLHH